MQTDRGAVGDGQDATSLKRLQRRKSGRGHTDWALVESYRTAGGSPHRVVAYLGDLKTRERSGWAQLCRRLNQEQRPQPSLFDPPQYDEPADDEPVPVKLKDIRLERLRDFGDGGWRWACGACCSSTYCCLSRCRRRRKWAALAEGCCQLRTNLTETDPAVLWKRYIQLTESDWAFRSTKDELEIRPVWHQKEERVKAHILVCFLAYALWKTLAQWMRAAGLGDAPRTLVEEFAKIKSGDVALKARWTDGREHPLRVRSVITPDKPQKELLHRLGLTLPQRLRTVHEVEQM